MAKGFQAAKKAGESRGGGSGFEQRPRGVTYFSLKNGETAVVRFLEGHDDIEWARKWKLAPTPSHRYGELVNAIDQLEDGTPDPGYQHNLKSGFKAYPSLIWRMAPQYVRDAEGKLVKDGLGNKQFAGNKDQVAVWECSFEVYNMLNELEIKYRSLTNLDWEIKRVGGGTDTKYMISPADVTNINSPMSLGDQQLAAAQKIDTAAFTKVPTFEALDTYLRGGIPAATQPTFGQQAANNAVGTDGPNPFL